MNDDAVVEALENECDRLRDEVASLRQDYAELEAWYGALHKALDEIYAIARKAL